VDWSAIFSRILLWASAVALATAVVASPAAVAGPFPSWVLDDSLLAADELIAAHPPEDFLYVGLGRSPTPVIAALQARLGAGAALNVPWNRAITKLLRGEVETTAYFFNESLRKRLLGLSRAELDAKLDVYFDAMLKTALAGKRGVVLVDFSWRGSSILSAERELNAYLARRGLARVVRIAPIAYDEGELKEHPNRIGSHRLMLAMKDGKFEKTSEYGTFALVNFVDERAPTPTQKAGEWGGWSDLLAAMRKRAESGGGMAGAVRCLLRRFARAPN